MQYQVLYQKNGRRGCVDFNATSYTKTELEETHVPLMFVHANDLEDVFVKMQGENWSPRGEAREFVRSKGLHHTSMSMGDIALDCQTGKYWAVIGIGFDEVK